MKTRKYFQIVVLLLNIGITTVFGQSKIIQKETDTRNHVSFVKFAADTICL
jgi:regulatory protein YycI of two-component signal transduction system YycFG